MRLAPLLSAWLPIPCVFCGAAGAHGGVCRGCRADLPGLEAARCPVCAIASSGSLVCGQCLKHPPAFARTVAVADYAFPLDAAIVRLKYGRDLGLVGALGQLLYKAVQGEPRPDLVVPMPLAPQRLSTRGFNQAAELARVAAEALRISLTPDAAARTRDAPPQASLPFAERARNVRGAFSCSPDVEGAKVVVVDDVMTTGSSLDELARELRRAGAEAVSCWVVARTPRPA
jgi:ComF family protein